MELGALFWYTWSAPPMQYFGFGTFIPSHLLLTKQKMRANQAILTVIGPDFRSKSILDRGGSVSVHETGFDSRRFNR